MRPVAAAIVLLLLLAGCIDLDGTRFDFPTPPEDFSNADVPSFDRNASPSPPAMLPNNPPVTDAPAQNPSPQPIDPPRKSDQPSEIRLTRLLSTSYTAPDGQKTNVYQSIDFTLRGYLERIDTSRTVFRFVDGSIDYAISEQVFEEGDYCNQTTEVKDAGTILLSDTVRIAEPFEIEYAQASDGSVTLSLGGYLEFDARESYVSKQIKFQQSENVTIDCADASQQSVDLSLEIPLEVDSDINAERVFTGSFQFRESIPQPNDVVEILPPENARMRPSRPFEGSVSHFALSNPAIEERIATAGVYNIAYAIQLPG
jgi:hypothetical protein